MKCKYKGKACCWHNRCHCLHPKWLNPRGKYRGSENTPHCVALLYANKCPFKRNKKCEKFSIVFLKKRVKDLLRQNKHLKALVAKQDEYIACLTREVDSIAFIAANHGWKSNQVEKGAKLRSQIRALKCKLDIEEKDKDEESSICD